MTNVKMIKVPYIPKSQRLIDGNPYATPIAPTFEVAEIPELVYQKWVEWGADVQAEAKRYVEMGGK